MERVLLWVITVGLVGCFHPQPNVQQSQRRATPRRGIAPRGIIAGQLPPAALAETVPAQPFNDGVWVPGYWDWNGFEWVWVPGTWAQSGLGTWVGASYRPYGNSACIYVPPRWEPTAPGDGGTATRANPPANRRGNGNFGTLREADIVKPTVRVPAKQPGLVHSTFNEPKRPTATRRTPRVNLTPRVQRPTARTPRVNVTPRVQRKAPSFGRVGIPGRRTKALPRVQYRPNNSRRVQQSMPKVRGGSLQRGHNPRVSRRSSGKTYNSVKSDSSSSNSNSRSSVKSSTPARSSGRSFRTLKRK